MQLSTDGIVLKEGELRENDKVLTILTQDYGLITAFANGARRLNSRLAAGASFLCYSDMRLFFNKGKYVLDDAFPKNIFYDIREDIESLSLASYLSELAQALAPVGDAAGDFLRFTPARRGIPPGTGRSRAWPAPLPDRRSARASAPAVCR